MKRALLTASLVVWLGLIVAPGARAVGGPIAPIQGNDIGVPGGLYRYVALDAGDATVVQRQATRTASAIRELRLSGHYGVPGADAAGATTGLSPDGRTLILAELPGNGPPHTTHLLVLATAPLAVRARLTLPGWSTVDAISPDGRWLYLIHYPSSDITRYEVLAYDLPARRLLAKPVVDPRERDEAMTGFAISRVMSIGGRWAYTLYLRPSGIPFIHALDTTRRRAVCVDLPSLANLDLGSAHLALGPGGKTLQVDVEGAAQASIDARTFVVSAGGGQTSAAPTPTVAAQTVAARRHATRAHDEVPSRPVVLAIAGLGVVALAAAFALSNRRRPHPVPGGELAGEEDQHRD